LHSLIKESSSFGLSDRPPADQSSVSFDQINQSINEVGQRKGKKGRRQKGHEGSEQKVPRLNSPGENLMHMQSTQVIYGISTKANDGKDTAMPSPRGHKLA
jgi:hypothetical protein